MVQWKLQTYPEFAPAIFWVCLGQCTDDQGPCGGGESGEDVDYNLCNYTPRQKERFRDVFKCATLTRPPLSRQNFTGNRVTQRSGRESKRYQDLGNDEPVYAL